MANALFTKLLKLTEEKPEDLKLYKDCLNVAKNALKTDKDKGLELTTQLKSRIGVVIRQGVNVKLMRDLTFEVLCAETPYSLDSYFQALEFDRAVEDKFYLPRRKILMPIVKALEDLLINDKLDELFISQPPRTGKSTLVMFAITWQIGVNPELANLYCSCSGGLCNAFYKGIFEILTDNYTYCWARIFPNSFFDKNTMPNAKETYLDVKRVRRYHSFTARSIDAQNLNGSCDANGVLIGDDLCSGIEEALNPERLTMLWLKVNNNLLSRAKMSCKIIWIGTR